ncbi:flagellar FliJ family protein [Cellulomonas sp. zg-ZUI222]|uniref:Flagellar FliJ protein n=1 Tax=Cellulomonas wangleii TaxID=2816956 RepID=A0ABX8D980_9CELL|nr:MULTISPECIES: flagellar FliJ family protein [Cellulomonas]MBO0901272.1 flagellar FliJ family protein [Cellulomonas sp. zg-ZUI22]MBO0922419.1 flagellar FliJ family protein [Cellulomonas wangleii]MBO0924860.1 flagellar FliJ family protein [Cellulomonas wangleii]QVI63026.1 flagellar FliJ family protein [Cellulomonas wangleii]
MSRPFPLAGLLRVRALAEDTAAAELAGARREERAAHERAARTAEVLGAARPPGEADVAAWQAAVAARLSLSALLTEDVERVRGAQDAVERRQEDWTAARIRTRAVERLRDKHDVAERQQEERAEQAVLDEVAARSTDPTAPGEDA